MKKVALILIMAVMMAFGVAVGNAEEEVSWARYRICSTFNGLCVDGKATGTGPLELALNKNERLEFIISRVQKEGVKIESNKPFSLNQPFGLYEILGTRIAKKAVIRTDDGQYQIQNYYFYYYRAGRIRKLAVSEKATVTISPLPQK